MEKGLIHVYHGDGKGKTTASIGLAIRAAGSGKKVIFVQFMKDGSSSEVGIFKGIANIEYKCCEGKVGFFGSLKTEEKTAFVLMQQNLFQFVKDKIAEINDSDDYLFVLDEATYLINYQIIDKNDFIKLLDEKPQGTEIVITGRNPDPTIIEKADYVSEICCKKHPFSNGIPARKGIEY